MAGLRRIVRTALRRGYQEVRRRARGPKARFFHAPAYAKSMSGVPMDALRAERIIAFLYAERLIVPEEIFEPKPITLREIRLVHTDAYLERLSRPEEMTRILGTEVGETEHDALLAAHRLMVGGTVSAVRAAAFGECIGINVGGGFHHAHAGFGHGFCVFNDIAVAIAILREAGFKERVLVIDLDLHDGDGTRAIFAADESVHTLSIHNQAMGDYDAVESTSIDLGSSLEDAPYLRELTRALTAIIDRFSPGLVIYLSGVDGARDDQIGDWNLTSDGLFERDELVLSLVSSARANIPLAIVLAGGYGSRAWRYSARFFGRLLSGRRIEPPSISESTILRFRSVAKSIDARALSERGSDIILTEDDLAGDLGIRTKPSRVLGFYTKHGVELALERYGFMDQLRVYGFAKPSVVLELGGYADLIRIYGDLSERELLVEMRLRRDAQIIPRFELLAIDWLLLQNPRSTFTAHRPKLPGQQHPGLGLLPEVIGLLMMACDRLQLDGVLQTPAHYHVARASRGLLRFLRPEDEASFAALEARLEGRSLHAASWAIENKEIPDATTGEAFRWRPMPMVLVVSDALRSHLAKPSLVE